jgi:L-threonylcarbamoyladenylate synthase
MTVLAFASDTEVRAATPRVAQHLEGGGLLAYPTETVYGLGSRPVEADVASLARLKGREEGKPFLLLVAHRDMAERYGLVFTAPARALADRFWPGPLTLVLPGGEGELPDALRGPEGGIAVRWTSHRGVQHLLAQIDTALTSTSANRPGGPTAPAASTIVEVFGSAVEAGTLLVLDGGVLGGVPPSTVIDCTGPEPTLVREGALSLSELRAAVGSLAL